MDSIQKRVVITSCLHVPIEKPISWRRGAVVQCGKVLVVADWGTQKHTRPVRRRKVGIVTIAVNICKPFQWPLLSHVAIQHDVVDICANEIEVVLSGGGFNLGEHSQNFRVGLLQMVSSVVFKAWNNNEGPCAIDSHSKIGKKRSEGCHSLSHFSLLSDCCTTNRGRELVKLYIVETTGKDQVWNQSTGAFKKEIRNQQDDLWLTAVLKLFLSWSFKNLYVVKVTA